MSSFASLSPVEQQTAVTRLLARGAEARKNPATFFGFVMREERTQTPIRVVPHQRLLLEFVWAHPRCVVRMPAGSSKTYCMAALTMFLLGRDRTVRGAILSATQAQASKPLGMVRDYIEQRPEIKIAFPALRRSHRVGDSWTQISLTVDRPAGIRDASLMAVGLDSAVIPGSRLDWIIVDDVLNQENTSTRAARDKVAEFFDSTVLSRVRGSDSRLVVTNTPWDKDDLTYRLEAGGWPTLTMDLEGGIHLSNCDGWDSDEIVPWPEKAGEWYRLASHEPDPKRETPLWPARFPQSEIDALRASHLPHRFQQLFMSQCRDEMSARCKIDWIEHCKAAGRGTTLVSEYKGGNPTVTGVDLAVGKTTAHDSTAFFTFEILPSGKRRILDIDVGQWDAPTIVAKVIAKHRTFNSIIRVESNAAQAYILQFVRAANANVPVKAHTTTAQNKAHLDFGIEGLFVELQNGNWIIPCDATGRCAKPVQEWVKSCLDYEPGKHVDDVLIASWLAREQARALGYGSAMRGGAQSNSTRGLGQSIMSR
jgi:hypothetical protein